MADHFGGVGIPPAVAAQSNAKIIYGAIISITIIATLAVVLRFVARRLAKAGFSYGR